MTFTSKLPHVGTTIFTIMSKLAADHGAINLSQGFPDFDPHPDLIDYVREAMEKGLNQYAPMQGVPELRQQIAKKIENLYGPSVDPDKEITITSGATEALYAAITAVVHPGDEVIIIEPAFDCYVPTIEICKGIPVYVPMEFPGYTIDWQRVKSVITERTRMIILNSPHNPTGSAFGPEDISSLQEIVAKNDIFLLSDEVYEHIIFSSTAACCAIPIWRRNVLR